MKANAFQNQVAVITGASSGIGKALAIKLASQGANLAIAARRFNRLEQIAAECSSLGGQTLIVPTDVSDELQCKTLIEKVIAAYGKLDLLINCTGLAAISLFNDFYNLDLFKHVMNVNFFGAVYCTYYALPYLKSTKGRIVMVSSVGGIAAIPYNTPYCASKFGLHGFSDSLRMELRSSSVSVTVICPWWVVTEFHAAQLNRDGISWGTDHGRDMYTKGMMSADRCAEIILNAAFKRQRRVLMGPGWLVSWLQVLAPDFLDWLAVKIFLESAVRRARASQAKIKESGVEEADLASDA